LRGKFIFKSVLFLSLVILFSSSVLAIDCWTSDTESTCESDNSCQRLEDLWGSWC